MQNFKNKITTITEKKISTSADLMQVRRDISTYLHQQKQTEEGETLKTSCINPLVLRWQINIKFNV